MSSLAEKNCPFVSKHLPGLDRFVSSGLKVMLPQPAILWFQKSLSSVLVLIDIRLDCEKNEEDKQQLNKKICTQYRLCFILEPCFYKWYISGKFVRKEENSSTWRSGLSYVMGVWGWCRHGERRSISSARLCFYTSGTAGKEPGAPLHTGRSLSWQRKAKIKNARTHKQSPQGETPIRRCSKSRRQDLWQNNGKKKNGDGCARWAVGM